MKTAEAQKFPRVENSELGQGYSVEYRDEQRHTLAFIDYAESGEFAQASVYDPSTGRSRNYGSRPASRAHRIVLAHLARLGYEPGEPAEDGTGEDDLLAAVAALPAQATTQELTDALPAQPAIIPDLTETHAAAAGEHDEWLRDVAAPAPEQGAWDSPAVRAAVAQTIAAEQPAADPEPAPEFADVADAADAILGAPEDEIIRHWRDVRGTVWQFHLRSICPPAETAAALRSFVSDVNSSAARGGRTMNSERRFYCWGPEGWNVGYAIILPA